MSGVEVEVELPKGRMSREAFLAWVEQQPKGRYERIDGEVFRMAAEMVSHARTKYRATKALDAAIAAAGVQCEALIDGVRVRVEDDHDYEPDALVNCGPPAAGDQLYAPNPVIIVEVTSRSTQWIDTGYKMIDYFKIPSVQHYLVLFASRRLVVHHRRTETSAIATTFVQGGTLQLDPPGMTVDVESMFGA